MVLNGLIAFHLGGRQLSLQNQERLNMLHEKLGCYTKSVSLAEELCKEVAKWPKGSGYLIDQLRRAVASVVLNIAEGNARRSPVERHRFFEVSRASLSEVSACIDLIKAFGFSGCSKAESYKSQANEISKMLWGLIK